jgi:hypothetical protein
VSAPNSADLARLSATVLADCAFLLTEPVDTAEPIDDAVHAVVAFSGATRGRLVLSASRELAEHVAADMLGIESGDPEARVNAEGAIAELANVLLGMLVVRFCDAEARWDFGTPSVHAGSAPETPGGRAQVATLACDSGAQLRVQWITELTERP